MNRYETNLKNTSPLVRDLRNEFHKMPRGVHDLSYQADFDASDGYIIPIDYHELVPNCDLYLRYDVSLLSHNPTFRRLLSSGSIELRTYKRNKNDSYMGWNNFITKGRTGKISKELPYVDFTLGSTQNSSTYSKKVCTLTPHSPAAYLGFVPSVFLGANPSNYSNFVKSSYPQVFTEVEKSNPSFTPSSFTTGLTGISSIDSIPSVDALKINALPLVFYNAISKEFWDLNVLQDNGNWVPENENFDMILPYEATGSVIDSSYTDWDKPIKSGENVSKVSADSTESRPFLNILRKANKRGDMFDTGSPFEDLIRGDIPTLQAVNARLNDPTVTSTIDFSDSMLTSVGTGNTLVSLVGSKLGTMSKSVGNRTFAKFDSSGNLGSALQSDSSTRLETNVSSNLKSALNAAKITSYLPDDTIKGITFSIQQWQALATLNEFALRMALTDGSYNQMIESQFAHNPRWHEHKPIFCGGSRQPLVFAEVVQNSASDPNGTPLGTTAGRSVSAQDNGEIQIHSDDYCDVMTVMVIRPEEYYCQGVDKRVSRLTNAEQYFPLMNNLAPDATLNKEIFVSGTNATDNDVFNYQERFAYYKSIRNRVSGLLALPFSVAGSISQYVKHRIFQTTPNFNHGFLEEAEDTNMKQVYTSSKESEYVIRVGVAAKLIGPIPEISLPADMGLSY